MARVCAWYDMLSGWTVGNRVRLTPCAL